MREVFGERVRLRRAEWEGLPSFVRGFLVSYGFGRSARALLMLPWNLATNPKRFAAMAPLSPAAFVLLPLIAIGLWRITQVRVLASLTGRLRSVLVLHRTRDAVPAAGAADSVSRARRFAPRCRRLAIRPGWRRWCWPPSSSFPGLIYATERCWRPGRFQRRSTNGTSTCYDSCRRTRPICFYGSRAGATTPRTAYSTRTSSTTLTVDRSGIISAPSGTNFIRGKEADPEALHATLKSFGAEYFIVNHQQVTMPFVTDQRFSRFFRTLLIRPAVSLFALNDAPVEVDISEELLINPGFEALEGGRPTGWTVHGEPIVDTSGANSASGAVAVRCLGSAHVAFQIISAAPGREYRLSFSAKGVVSGVHCSQADQLARPGPSVPDDKPGGPARDRRLAAV